MAQHRIAADIAGETDRQRAPWNCEYYVEHGRMMPEDGSTRSGTMTQSSLGPWASVPGSRSRLALGPAPGCSGFEQYVIRPVRLIGIGHRSPAARRATSTSSSCGRTRGEYPRSAAAFEGTDDEIVLQTSVFTRRGVDRIMRYAFERATRVARRRPATANGVFIAMPTGTGASVAARYQTSAPTSFTSTS